VWCCDAVIVTGKTEWYDNDANGVIFAPDAAESANIATYALMAFT